MPAPGADVLDGFARQRVFSCGGAGAAIAEYQPPMLDYEVEIVDGLFTLFGSTNFDNRSFQLNEAATVNILD